jgi:hypothetical protein
VYVIYIDSFANFFTLFAVKRALDFFGIFDFHPQTATVQPLITFHTNNHVCGFVFVAYGANGFAGVS